MAGREANARLTTRASSGQRRAEMGGARGLWAHPSTGGSVAYHPDAASARQKRKLPTSSPLPKGTRSRKSRSLKGTRAEIFRAVNAGHGFHGEIGGDGSTDRGHLLQKAERATAFAVIGTYWGFDGIPMGMGQQPQGVHQKASVNYTPRRRFKASTAAV